jgi:phospholipid N-methyltransferase
MQTVRSPQQRRRGIHPHALQKQPFSLAYVYDQILRCPQLDGKSPVAAYASIANQIEATRDQGTPRLVHGDYFRVRVFGNGNLHVWFERADLLREANKLLAEYYGEAIGEGVDAATPDDSPRPFATPAKNFGFFPTSESVADKMVNYASIGRGTRVLEPSAGTGVLARAALSAGALVTCVELQAPMARELITAHDFEAVHCADFLTMTPAQLGIFDVVMMNPPFDNGRDCDHVAHALQFVREGGILVAIMAARAEFSDNARAVSLRRKVAKWPKAYGWLSQWIDLPAGSFAHAGTNVNTVVLAIRRPAF